MAAVRSTAHTTAAPDTVWEVLADHAGMASWTPVSSVTLEREGDPAPNGVGAVRVIRAPLTKLREEVTAFEPASRLAYRMLSGAPVRNYNAEARISAAGDGGTDIVWTASFEPRLPGVGLVVGRVIAQLANGLAREAARRASA